MKNLFFIFSAFWLLFFTGTALAQNYIKIGHVDVKEIMSSLPESDSAQILIDKESRELEASLEEMQVIYNRLVNDYQKGLSSFSDLVKTDKESEIIDKQQRLHEFEQNVSVKLQQRSQELFQPIYDKIIKTIEKVATENGFTYILDVSKGSVVFVSKDSQNINQMVLYRLKKS